jgi:hypothetical protein
MKKMVKQVIEPSDLKAHRMVNVVLDEAAAQGLPEDVTTLLYCHVLRNLIQ